MDGGRRLGRSLAPGMLAVLLALSARALRGQSVEEAVAQPALSADASAPPPTRAVLPDGSAALPDAPGSSAASSRAVVQASLAQPTTEASSRQGVIQPGQTAPPLDGHDKLMLGLRRTVSPMAVTGWFFSAGYGQLNGTPHYGSDRAGFGERLGAAALRDASEAVLTDGVAAPAFHQDPRYYRLGPGRSFPARLGYAALQPFLTRTDGGGRAINLSLMTGTLAGSALTNLYYPQIDRSVSQTFKTFGFSMEGSIIGNLVREFFPDVRGFVFRRGR